MRFVSKFKNHAVVMSHTNYKTNEFGGREINQGRVVQFEDCKYSTEDPLVIRFLLSHKMYGTDFHGFDENNEKIDGPKYLANIESMAKAREAKAEKKALAS